MFRFAAYLVAVDTLVPMVSVVAFPFVRKGMVCCCNFFRFCRLTYGAGISHFALCRAGRLFRYIAVIPSMRGFVDYLVAVRARAGVPMLAIVMRPLLRISMRMRAVPARSFVAAVASRKRERENNAHCRRYECKQFLFHH